MITWLIITGVFVTLIIYLGFRDWHHSKLPDNEPLYLKYSSPELYIISILGILIGVFIIFWINIYISGGFNIFVDLLFLSENFFTIF
jgi:hypothetical protein